MESWALLTPGGLPLARVLVRRKRVESVSIQIPLPAPALECPLVSGWVYVEQLEEGSHILEAVSYGHRCSTVSVSLCLSITLVADAKQGNKQSAT